MLYIRNIPNSLIPVPSPPFAENLLNFTATTCGTNDITEYENPRNLFGYRDLSEYVSKSYLFSACSTATATATVAPTIGLLPIPRKPIISTCAGTDEEPANCASECMRPMVSVIP